MVSDDTRFKHIGLSSDGGIVFCELDNGKTYSMPVAALDRAEDWDADARPKTVGILHDGYAAFVKFDNKITIDFPADFVLHICEGKGRAVTGVGRRIREIRKARGLTLDALSKKCDVAKPNLSRLEHDKMTPKLETLRAVASGLGIHPTLLLQTHTVNRTLIEFREWKRVLRYKANERPKLVRATQLLKVFLAGRPEHRYSCNELAHYLGDISVMTVNALTWARELAAVDGSGKQSKTK